MAITDFLKQRGIDPSKYIVRVNRQPVCEDYEVTDGDRISLTPRKYNPTPGTLPSFR